MRILLTGASGFLGSAIRELSEHDVLGVGRDVRNAVRWDASEVPAALPACEIVVHAAGLAHTTPRNQQEVRRFREVNVNGTANLLTGLETGPPACFVFISSVAVYGAEEGELISETAPLRGTTPYAQSKIEGEEIVSEWGRRHSVRTVILRLPLVSGLNPPGNLAALYRAIKNGYYVRVGAGTARKSMVGAPDVAALLPTLIGRSGIFNLTDGRHPEVSDVDSQIASLLGKRVRSLPEGLMQVAAQCGDFIPRWPLNSRRLSQLTRSLTFDDAQARRELAWNPNPALTCLRFD